MSEVPSPRAPRRLSAGRLLLFSGVTCLLFLAGLEGLLQVLAAHQGPQHHVPVDGSLPDPDPLAFRVVAVGDSWVYGAESEPDEAFIEVFRREAAARLGRPVQVYNLGVSASNSSQALLALAGAIERAQPNLVVALTGANNLLHDQGVAQAARLMGEDARMVPGLTLLSGLRTVRLARLLWVALAPASLAADPSRGAGSTDGSSAPGASAVGTAGLVSAPPVHTTQVVRLPWWDLHQERRWSEGLALLMQSPPPADSPELRGVWLAWQALFRARMGERAAGEALASEALALRGDDAVAHEALAVLAAGRGASLVAWQHRVRAATSPGHPWIRERARGLVLLEIEAWEAAATWLLSVQRATPGDYDSLLGLARLPQVVRDAEIEALLYRGPVGRVQPDEYFAWHLASSGMLDRAAASLGGDVDPGEPPPIQIARARAAELGGDRPAALSAFRALGVTQDDDAAAAGRAGLLRIVRDPVEIAALLGATPEQLLAQRPRPHPAVGLALIAWFREAERCPEAVEAALGAIDAGALPAEVELVGGRCLSGEINAALAEMSMAREGPVDRTTLILGQPPATPVPAPTFTGWADLRDRRLDPTTCAAPVAWCALAAAFSGAPEVALALASEGAKAGADPAVSHLARGLALRQQGRGLDALVAWARAAEEPPPSDPWARMLAEGLGAASAQRWERAQERLLGVVAVAPGQLEALEGLAEVPDEQRWPATDAALRYGPAGRVRADRWVAWYLRQSRPAEAALALRWSWSDAGSQDAPRVRAAPAGVDCGEVTRGVVEALERGEDPASLLERSDSCVPPRRLMELLDARLATIPDLPPLAREWLRARLQPGSPPPPKAPRGNVDLLVRELDAMHRVASTQGARFVALTYPFPSSHHARVRDTVIAGGAARAYPVLDLYGWFEQRYSPVEWQAMRTPQDHVNARGYAEIGARLADWASQERLLPGAAPASLH